MNGSELKQARERLRLMQKDFASICGLTPERISRMETGAAPVEMRVEMIAFLLEANPASVNAALDYAARKKEREAVS